MQYNYKYLLEACSVKNNMNMYNLTGLYCKYMYYIGKEVIKLHVIVDKAWTSCEAGGTSPERIVAVCGWKSWIECFVVFKLWIVISSLVCLLTFAPQGMC